MTTKFIEDLMQRFAVLAEQEPESNILLRTLASADPVVREEFFSYLKKASENSLAPALAAAADAPPRHWSDDLPTEPQALPPIALAGQSQSGESHPAPKARWAADGRRVWPMFRSAFRYRRPAARSGTFWSD
jgi:hypothetical protein